MNVYHVDCASCPEGGQINIDSFASKLLHPIIY